MDQNIYLERLRRESYILDHNRNATHMNPSVIIGNKTNLESHLLQIRGNEQGIYFDSHFRETPPTLTILKEKQKELEKKWEKFCTDQLKIGNARPKQMPEEMQQESDKIAARIQVCHEEIEWLEKHLKQAMEQQSKSKGSLLTHPKHWCSGSLRHGVLESVGPWTVGMDEEKGVLCITDPDSPYLGIPVYRFRAEITKPMSQEFSQRLRTEEKAALAENRKRKQVSYPKPGIWRKESDFIEYESYSNEVIKKLKREN